MPAQSICGSRGKQQLWTQTQSLRVPFQNRNGNFTSEKNDDDLINWILLTLMGIPCWKLMFHWFVIIVSGYISVYPQKNRSLAHSEGFWSHGYCQIVIHSSWILTWMYDPFLSHFAIFCWCFKCRKCTTTSGAPGLNMSHPTKPSLWNFPSI